MADDRTPADEETPEEPTAGEEQQAEDAPAQPPTGEEQAAPVEPERQAAEAAAAQEPVAETLAAVEGSDDAEATPEAKPAEPAEAQPAAAEPAEAQPAAAEPTPPAAAQPTAEAPASDDDEDDEQPAPRVKPEIPGADLEVDIVTEGADLYSRGESPYDEDEEAEPAAEDTEDVPVDQPIAAVTIDLAAGARYRATGKRKTAVARVTLRPGDGSYLINGRVLDEFFPRSTLQRNIRQPLEAVGYETRMDVVARLHGGGVSAQAGALRHGISRALLEADPNLRGELKRRGFLTRDPRVKERKKAGLKKARKRPQFSKR
jgi:small subunit ribosomal protein S9